MLLLMCYECQCYGIMVATIFSFFFCNALICCMIECMAKLLILLNALLEMLIMQCNFFVNCNLPCGCDILLDAGDCCMMYYAN